MMVQVLHMPDHHHTPEKERKIRDATLDETVEGSFPAPSTIPNPDDDDVLEEPPPT